MVAPNRAVDVLFLEAGILVIQIYSSLVVSHEFPLAMYAFDFNDILIEIADKAVIGTVRSGVSFMMAIELCYRVTAHAQMEALFFSFFQALESAEIALRNSSDVLATLEMDYFASSFTAEIKHTFHHLFRLFRICAEEIFIATYKWLKTCGCDKLVNVQLIEQYAMSVSRWIQCEEAISEYGFIAKHPTTGNAIASPYVAMSRDYMKQVNSTWFSIYQIVKENCSVEYGGATPHDDLMERLLQTRRGK